MSKPAERIRLTSAICSYLACIYLQLSGVLAGSGGTDGASARGGASEAICSYLACWSAPALWRHGRRERARWRKRELSGGHQIALAGGLMARCGGGLDSSAGGS